MRFEADIAKTLQEVVSETLDTNVVCIYHRSVLPRRIYIEAPDLLQVQLLLKLSAHDCLLEHAVQIRDVDHRFLKCYGTFKVPPINSLLRIEHPGLYDDDICLIVEHLGGDLISIAVIPCLNRGNKWKRGRPSLTVLESGILWQFPMSDASFYILGPR